MSLSQTYGPFASSVSLLRPSQCVTAQLTSTTSKRKKQKTGNGGDVQDPSSSSSSGQAAVAVLGTQPGSPGTQVWATSLSPQPRSSSGHIGQQVETARVLSVPRFAR